jgi:hypothetical protein
VFEETAFAARERRHALAGEEPDTDAIATAVAEDDEAAAAQEGDVCEVGAVQAPFALVVVAPKLGGEAGFAVVGYALYLRLSQLHVKK